MSNSLQPNGLWPTWLVCPSDFPGKNTGLGWHFLLQGIFLMHESNLHLVHWQLGLYWWESGKPSCGVTIGKLFLPRKLFFYLGFQYICMILGKIFCLTSFVCGYFLIFNIFLWLFRHYNESFWKIGDIKSYLSVIMVRGMISFR